MWSGSSGQEGVISFGMTSQQFCSFQVTKPQEGARLYVLNPYSKDYFWIDADAVGPVPDQRTQVWTETRLTRTATRRSMTSRSTAPAVVR